MRNLGADRTKLAPRFLTKPLFFLSQPWDLNLAGDRPSAAGKNVDLLATGSHDSVELQAEFEHISGEDAHRRSSEDSRLARLVAAIEAAVAEAVAAGAFEAARALIGVLEGIRGPRRGPAPRGGT